jgi:outer membrane lipoprotein SlyB
MKKTIIIGLAILSTACAGQSPYLGTDYSGTTYTGKQMQQSQNVMTARVINIRQIKIQDDPGIVGQSAGAGLGALAVLGFAGTSGNPYGLAAGVIAAALGGGAVSKQIANKLYSTEGYEFTVLLKDGRAISVSQANVDNIIVGDTVYLTRANDNNSFKIYKTTEAK